MTTWKPGEPIPGEEPFIPGRFLGIEFVTDTYAFNSGEAFIGHNLGVTPVAVFAIAQGAVNNVATLDYTSTQFRAFIRNINTGNALTGNETLHWLAIA